MMTFVVFIIALALFFDFLNGFHDAANSIATVVSTRVLKPYWAVIWAAFFNFIAFLFFKLEVANTIGTGIIDPSIVNPHLICAALFGAIIWNIITWYYGLPSSSSHALFGGLLGAGLARANGNFDVINITGITKIFAAIFLSPILGFVFGVLFMFLIVRLFWRVPRLKADKLFKRLQLVSAALISLGHGGNDAQKTMGIIAVLLFSSNLLGDKFYVPIWVVITCNFVMALGTLFGGWKIVRTMGMRITKLKPVSGFCAETASAMTLFIATHFGIPVSTTHTIAGSIFGTGSLFNFSAVRWGIARRIVWAWVITVPAAALVAVCFWWMLYFIVGL
ncbi:MAG: inorganic phosphate transporter [Gammaproteobacteria bacterium]|nr:inorganic phosphate transporter [Gammaproteobacteria bacterium]